MHRELSHCAIGLSMKILKHYVNNNEWICAVSNKSVTISDTNDAKKYVIIIEPQYKEQLKSFFNNDLRLVKNLQNSIIGPPGIRNVIKKCQGKY